VILSRSSQYAFELILYIVKHDYKNYISLNIIAEDLELSFHFLGKIAQPLVKKGFLASFRGPYGGVKLAKDPKEISHYDILVAIEGEAIFENCMLRPVKCDSNHQCPIHDFDSGLRDNVKQAFKNQTFDIYINNDNK